MPKTANENNSMLVTDLGSVKMKQTLINIAKNTHHGTLTNLVRSTMHKLIESTPEHVKSHRRDRD